MISAAKDSFIERIRIYNHALQHSILIDSLLTNIDHNERARFLRNGLAITGFNILEDFIKNRIGEVLALISTSGIDFSRLPERIQEITLFHSLKGIHVLSQRKKDNSEDWKLFIQQETEKISSTQNTTYQLSPYSIGWDKSNLGKSDIESFLGHFKVGNVWVNINEISRAIGQTIPFPDQFFQSAGSRRHSAAHNPNALVSYIDLEAYGLSVKSFAFALDALLSQSARFIIDNDVSYLTTSKKIVHSDIQIRYIKMVNTSYKEMSANNTTVIGSFPTLAAAVSSLRGRRNYQNEFIVVSDSANNLLFWHTGF
ncbi:HEPN domain-containing protein [Mucilaginibacter sp.]|uniref:HEPN domain-containing protein n=1 Tax=Mucilaginibacter sp. TaxID=1882438 RepID=UPI0025CBA15D|nr:HEPN domain-containing protein [Mucilaginibacter sp.]